MIRLQTLASVLLSAGLTTAARAQDVGPVEHKLEQLQRDVGMLKTERDELTASQAALESWVATRTAEEEATMRAAEARLELLANLADELDWLRAQIRRGERDFDEQLQEARGVLADAGYGQDAPATAAELAHIGRADQAIVTVQELLYERNLFEAGQLLTFARAELDRARDIAAEVAFRQP